MQGTAPRAIIAGAFKSAVADGLQKLIPMIEKVTKDSCIGSPLAGIDEITLRVIPLPYLYVHYRTQNEQKSYLIIDKRFIEGANEGDYGNEARLYVSTLDTLMKTLPGYEGWKEISIPIPPKTEEPAGEAVSD